MAPSKFWSLWSGGCYSEVVIRLGLTVPRGFMWTFFWDFDKSEEFSKFRNPASTFLDYIRYDSFMKIIARKKCKPSCVRWFYLDVLSQVLDLLLELGLLRVRDLELHRQVSNSNLEFGFRDFWVVQVRFNLKHIHRKISLLQSIIVEYQIRISNRK